VLEVALDDSGIAAVAVDLQVACGAKVSFLAAGDGKIAIEFEDEELARRCLDAALHPPADLAALRDYAGDVLLGPNTRAIFDAARLRGIPVRRLDQGSLLQLGYGVHQRRMCGAETDRTSSIGENLGWEKPLAKQLLRAVGVPTPEGRLVRDADDACHAAAELGGSVVVKPEAANHGRSVFIGLTDPAEIAAAYQSARVEGEGTNVLVERCIPGAEHRVLVVNHRVAAATRGDELYITGDGIRTLVQFVDELNQDPRRGDDAEAPLSPVGFDQVTLAVLARQGYQPDSIPPAGERVLIQRNGNLAVDVTNQVHPENAALVILAARTIGIDVAGVDLVVENIGRPIREQGGAILEVNAMPGIMMHLRPGVGTPRPVHEIIMEFVFPPGANGRIPIVAVHAGKDSSAIAHEVAHRLSATGLTVGLSATDGTFVDGLLTRAGDCASSQAAADLLLHPMIQAAVFETPDAAILTEGLAFDHCDVAIVTGPQSAATAVLLATLAPTGKIVETAAEAILALSV
jgi:cyanophycin synthetase